MKKALFTAVCNMQSMRQNLRSTTYIVLLTIFVFLTFSGCEKDKSNTLLEESIPTVTTAEVSEITVESATCGGNVTSDGGLEVTRRGVCWSTTQNPSFDNCLGKTEDGTGSGTFTSIITSLEEETTYYVCAYATNSKGTSYGEQEEFTTLLRTTVPTVTTAEVTEITGESATCGGNVTSDGGLTVTKRGVCWSTTQNPSFDNCLGKTEDGTGTGSFTSIITSLEEETTYYVCAYAVNSNGLGYGEIKQFNVTSIVTDVDGNTYRTVTIGSQTWMAENLKTTKYNDGTTIPHVPDDDTWSNLTTPGYCWYGNDISNKTTYGALYNWYTVNTEKLCPTGWHVPSYSDWNPLIIYVGGPSVGGELKEIGTTHWVSPNTGATDTYGFTALPSGFRYAYSGTFYNLGYYGHWWTSTEFDDELAYQRYVSYDNGSINGSSWSNWFAKQSGFSVRCIRD